MQNTMIHYSLFIIKKLGALAVILFCLPFSSWADCTFSTGTITLPSSSSFTVASTSLQAQGSGGISCSGVILNLLGYNSLSVKINSSTNNMKLKNANGDTIPYLIYPDSSYQTAYTVGQTINYSNAQIVALFPTSSATVPLYVGTTPGSNVSAGSYTDSINLLWSYYFCTIQLAMICIGAFQGTNVPVSVNVNLTVTNSCVINSAPNVNFGTQSLILQFTPITQNLSVTCTKSSTYNVYFANGNNYVTPWNNMSNGANFLQYQLYQQNGTTVMNSSNMVTQTGTGNAQSITYQAIINPSQSNVPAGTYTDNVSATVVY